MLQTEFDSLTPTRAFNRRGFVRTYRPSFRNDAAEDGWKRCVAWLAANGVA